MFCRNCAEVMLDTDITCPNCGFAAGTGLKYCAQCGSETAPGAVICEICGNPVSSAMAGGAAAAFQQQPQFQQQTQFQQQAQFQQPFQQQFQQPFQQQTVNLQKGTPFQQPGAQQFRTVDPNATFQQQPGAFQQNAANQYYGTMTYKSKMTAGLLGIFLGALGVHNFYLGYTTKGMIQLLMTLLSCGTLGVVSEIWGLVEGIMILTGSINQDGKGLPLKE